jgi:hypothetical protein
MHLVTIGIAANGDYFPVVVPLNAPVHIIPTLITEQLGSTSLILATVRSDRCHFKMAVEPGKVEEIDLDNSAQVKEWVDNCILTMAWRDMKLKNPISMYFKPDHNSVGVDVLLILPNRKYLNAALEFSMINLQSSLLLLPRDCAPNIRCHSLCLKYP